MGTLALDTLTTTQAYGELAARFNGLRLLYNCVRSQMNTHKSPEVCLDAR